MWVVADAARRLAHHCEHPLVVAAIVEGDEEDPLVLAEIQASVAERDLLRARSEQHRHEAGPFIDLEWDQPLQQALEVREEARLALLDSDQRRIAVRRDICDSAPARR